MKDLCKIKFDNAPFEAVMQTFFAVKKLPVDRDLSSDYPDISSDSSFETGGHDGSVQRSSGVHDRSNKGHSDKPMSSIETRTNQSTTKPIGLVHSKQHPVINVRQVIINEITDPKTLSVQYIEFGTQCKQLMKECNQCAMTGQTPNHVVVDEMYLVYENNKEEWHRAVVTKRQKSVTVYLIDHGRHVTVMPNQ